MIKSTFFLLIFCFKLYAYSCKTPATNIISLDIVNSCNKDSYGEIKGFCDCKLFKLELSETEILKTENEHNQLIAEEFQKHMTKAMFSISGDLNILDGKIDKSSENKLQKSCGTVNIKSITTKCSKIANSYINLIGSDKMSKFEDQLGAELSKKQEPHLNTGGACEDNPQGYVERCDPAYKSSCNMSDNLADAIFMDSSKRKLAHALIGYSKINSSKLSTNTNLSEQFFDADLNTMSDEDDFEYKGLVSYLEDFRQNAYLNEIRGNTNSITFINNILSQVSELSANNSKNDLTSKVSQLVEAEITKNRLDEVQIKCDNLYKKVEEFLCADTSNTGTDNFTALSPKDFMEVISSDDHAENAFGASKYYCSKVVNNKVPSKIKNPIEAIENLLYESEKSSPDVKSMANSSFGNQSQKVRGTEDEPMLCLDVYGPVNELAKEKGLNDPVTPQEEVNLYTFQIEEYKKKYNECKETDNEQKCDFIYSLIKITNDKLGKAEIMLKSDEAEQKAALKAGDDSYRVRDRGYYEEIAKSKSNNSLAQRVLLGEAPTPPKRDTPIKEKEASKKATNEKSETTLAPSVVANSPVAYQALTESNAASENLSTSPVPAVQTQSEQTISFLNLEAKKDTDNLLQQIQTAKDEYKKLKSKDPSKLAEIQNNLKAKKNLDLYDSIGSDHLNDMDLSYRHDTGEVSTDDYKKLFSGVENNLSGKNDFRDIAPSQRDINRAISNAKNENLKNSDSVTLSPFIPTNGPLINEHGLIDGNGNVTPIMEVKIKGSIENDLRDVLKNDEENAITHDRKMILSDPNQFKQFKILAKALEKKQTFLISRHDNEDIKLIVKYNSVTRQYTVEPFTDKERLIQYEADYVSFQENISNAIKDKTFDTLMKKYKED